MSQTRLTRLVRHAAGMWCAISAALGETGRLGHPKRNDLALFERIRFIDGVKDGAVDFNHF